MKSVLKHINSILLDLFFVFISLCMQAQTFPVEKKVFNGPADKFINLVFLSDGFQENEMGSFVTYAESTGNNMLNESPYKEYKNYFNLIAIKVPSQQSGSNHPRTVSDCPPASEHPILSVGTYFNTTFDSFNIHRLLVANNFGAVNNVVSANFPWFDQKIILANTTFYGGSGGENSVASLDPSANEIVLHESAHTFGGLSDEYWAGEQYAHENVNMSKESNPALVRWKNWIGVDGVGVYAYGTTGAEAIWYHPHQNCKMKYLGVKFCPVCREALVLKILQKFGSPIKSSVPIESKISMKGESMTLELELYKPNPNTLKTIWLLNGSKIMQNKDSILLKATQLQVGINTLQVQVLDTTSMIRDESHPQINTYSVSWTIEKLSTGLTMTTEEAMPGLRVFPSPFTNEFTIEDQTNDDEKVYEILNATGEVLQQGKFNGKIIISAKNYASELYLIKISAKGEVAYRKIVKL